jgi:hypothetical protein
MEAKDIIDAYTRIRTIDQTIPDDVLDFMKNAAIEALKPNTVKADLTEVWLTALAQQQVIKKQIAELRNKSHPSNIAADGLLIGHNVIVEVMDDLTEIINKL